MFLIIPARYGRFSGEGTLPPSLASLAGIAGPAPPRKPPRLFLCQALSPETTRPEAPTGGAASAARAGAGGFLRGGGGGGGEEAWRARPAHPCFLRERGEVRDCVPPVLRWVARLGPLVSRDRKGLRAQRGRGEWAEHQVVSPGRPGSRHSRRRRPWPAFCRRSDLLLAGAAGQGQGPRDGGPVGAGLLLAPQSPLPACLGRRARACAGRQGGRGQRRSEWGGGGGELRAGKARVRDRGPGGREA